MKQIRETSDFVCLKIYDKIDTELLYSTSQVRMLEPSCGEGKIIEFIERLLFNKIDLTCIELNEERLFKAKTKILDTLSDLYEPQNQKTTFIKGDFLFEGKKLGKQDLILACPPFKNNIDLEHIKLMYDLLDKGGQLISLTSPYWLTNNEEHQVAFRSWLENKKYDLTMLPDNSFMEKGKTVPTAIIKINK